MELILRNWIAEPDESGELWMWIHKKSAEVVYVSSHSPEASLPELLAELKRRRDFRIIDGDVA